MKSATYPFKLFIFRVNGFNPRTQWRVRRCIRSFCWWWQRFQSTHSMKSATLSGRYVGESERMFQSTHSMKSATPPITNLPTCPQLFQSTHSMKSATWKPYPKCPSPRRGFNPRTQWRVRHNIRIVKGIRLVSIHALNEECDLIRFYAHPIFFVSIHALNEECDHSLPIFSFTHSCFNPRTQWRVRLPAGFSRGYETKFQSTHSMKSATFIAGLSVNN